MSQSRHRTSLAATLALFLLTWGGCNSSVGPISGMVRFDDDSPVQSGSIEFRDLATAARFSSRIRPDGTFSPVDSDDRPGLPPGEYEVVVVQLVLTKDLALEAHSHGHTVPRRYADYYTSDLRLTVSQGQTAPVRIELQSE